MKKTFSILILALSMAVLLASCGGGGGGGGGSAPPQPPQSVNLPRTGQIISYGTGSIDDGALQRGVAWPSPRFTVGTGAEVDCVTDNLTGLMWVKAPDAIGRSWQAALDHADGLALCGHTDWRLPNRKELRSLANYGPTSLATWLNAPAQGFSNVQADNYWSSSTDATNTGFAWGVDMFDGSVGADNKLVSYYVWPVRSGQANVADAAYPANIAKTGQITSYGTGTIDDGALQRGVAWPSPRFTAGTGAEVDCITDNLTGLIWVKAPDAITRTWQAALDHADGLTLCGHSDWRLPNVNELESLVNAGQADSASWLNTQGFSNVKGDYYWSSSTYAAQTTGAWNIGMFDGRVNGGLNKTLSIYAWPVRGGQ